MSSDKRGNETTNGMMNLVVVMYEYIINHPIKMILCFCIVICVPLIIYVHILNPYDILNKIPRIVMRNIFNFTLL